MPWRNDADDRRRSAATYGDPEYRRNRTVAMRRDNWRCRIRTPGTCIGAARKCDHIVPVSQGGTHNLSNLRAACDPCHDQKTAQEGGGFRRPGSSGDPQPQPRTSW
jgi:5-methylcytosine-specific restriction protein A